MTFLIVVLMSAVTVNQPQTAYIFVEPTFINFNQCRVFVEQNHKELYGQAIKAYNYKYPPKEIYCADKDAVESMMKESKGTSI